MPEQQDFDGIKENDNKLPKGWLIAFIAGIVFVVVYITMYTEELGGESWNKNHEKEMAKIANKKAKEQVEDKAAPVKEDEKADGEDMAQKTPDPNAIAGGEKVYKTRCMVCHMADLKSGTSNLLAPELKYGNSQENIMKVILDGTAKGMLPFGNILSKKEKSTDCAYMMSKRETK